MKKLVFLVLFFGVFNAGHLIGESFLAVPAIPNWQTIVKNERPPGSKAREIARNDRFIAYDNGIVRDTLTGLEWIAGPDKDTTWDEARSWVQSLSVDDGGWRMPTREELRTLYIKGAGIRNMTPLLKTTGRWIWSAVKWGSSSARVFSFHHGFEHSHPLGDSGDGRGFVVCSRR